MRVGAGNNTGTALSKGDTRLGRVGGLTGRQLRGAVKGVKALRLRLAGGVALLSSRAGLRLLPPPRLPLLLRVATRQAHRPARAAAGTCPAPLRKAGTHGRQLCKMPQ